MAGRQYVHLVAFCFGFALAGCGGSLTGPLTATASAEGAGHQVTVSITSHQAALVLGVNALKLHVTDTNGAPVDGADVAVSLFMPAHGHGSSAKPLVTSLGNGDYDVENVVLTMPGAWELTAHVTKGALDDAATLQLEVP